jgi:septal ring factor EnvC (AmiA/AmiB activator)
MTIEQIPLSFWFFLAGQCLTIACFFIKFWNDHTLLKQRVCQMEKNCKQCKRDMNDNVHDKTSDLKTDLEEMKTDFKDMKKELENFKISILQSMAEIKTLISNKTVQL